jgi:hypothetical protein
MLTKDFSRTLALRLLGFPMIQMAESVRASELNDGEAAAAHVRDNRGEVGCVSASASLTDLENNPGNELSAQGWVED